MPGVQGQVGQGLCKRAQGLGSRVQGHSFEDQVSLSLALVLFSGCVSFPGSGLEPSHSGSIEVLQIRDFLGSGSLSF